MVFRGDDPGGALAAEAAREAAAELRRTLGRLELALASVSDAIAWTDERGRLAWCNQAFERLAGGERIALLCRPIGEILPLRRDGRAAEFGVLGAAWSGDYELPRPGAPPRELHVVATPVGGAGLGVMLTISDQSELRAALRAASRSNSDLEHFAYVASHDLKAPLRKITTFIDVLSSQLKGTLDEQALRTFGRIQSSASRMAELVDCLLDYALIGREESAPFGPVPLAEAFAEARENVDAAREAAQGRIESGELPTVLGDRRRLVQLLQNLLENGLKFRAPGRSPALRASARRDGGLWEIAVADNGIGIPAQSLEKVFDLFSRGHAGAEYPGLGMGLATCRKIVAQHGGRIRAESEPGKGTTIRFTLRPA